MKMRSVCFVLITVLISTLVNAQVKDSLVGGEFKEASLESFVREIESQSDYHFFYDIRDFETTRITLSTGKLNLKKLLELAFRDTDIYFSTDADHHVFLTRKYRLLTTLPPGFYSNTNTNSVSATDNGDVPGFSETGRPVKTVSENKLYEIGARTNNLKGNEATLSGYVRNQRTGEPIINALIFVDRLQRAVTTDANGYYSLAIKPGRHILNVQGSGARETNYQVAVYSDGKFDIELSEQVTTLKEVVVATKNTTQLNRVQLGMERLTLATIKKVPTVFGESDVLRVVLSLPGVKTVGEASTGFNVRGGAADQNLILLNESTIYNPSHFFGMFSALNPEIVKDIELYKSSIPAKYGGRLASVLEISTREGNKKEYTGSAGIGLITSRINFEGPIIKNKTSFIVGARTTYANWLMGLLPKSYENSRASFNDVNLNISHQINKKNDLYFTGYFSNDKFNLASDTQYSYSNRNISLKWKHNFNSKLNLFVTTGYDQYQFNVSSEKVKVNAFKMGFDINQMNFKTDFAYYLNSRHTMEFGVGTIKYQLNPGYYEPAGSGSLVSIDRIDREQAFESAIYLSDKYEVNDNLLLSAGVRYSVFNNIGPQEIRRYAENLPKEESNLLNTEEVEKGRIVKTYRAPEFRLSLRYNISDNLSVKAGYNSTLQYLHVLSNTTAIAPTDIWKLSDANIKPQKGDQFSIGFYRNFKSNTIETSVEVYYKRLNDYLDYKAGATLVLNHHIETDVLPTKGKAYGVEFMVKKPGGKLNGWVTYTYSRILLKMDDPTVAEPVNQGRFYPANYDKPHDALLVGNFKINHRFSVSMNVNYSTGRPITLPIGRYYYAGSQRVLYSNRNEYRIPDYFRTDLSMNIDGNHKVKQRTHNSWTIGFYNLTGRRNPYSIYFVSENGLVNGYKMSIFGSIIPFINFNIRFQ